jgi:hypothetical protein
VWFDARPILLEVGCAALLMGLAFPVANAIDEEQTAGCFARIKE